MMEIKDKKNFGIAVSNIFFEEQILKKIKKDFFPEYLEIDKTEIAQKASEIWNPHEALDFFAIHMVIGYEKSNRGFAICFYPNSPKEQQNTVQLFISHVDILLGENADRTSFSPKILELNLGETFYKNDHTTNVLDMINLIFSPKFNLEEKRDILWKSFGIKLTDTLKENITKLYNYMG